MPSGFKREQLYEAIVVFAENPQDPALDAAVAEQERRNAWYHDPIMVQREEPTGTRLAARQ